MTARFSVKVRHFLAPRERRALIDRAYCQKPGRFGQNLSCSKRPLYVTYCHVTERNISKRPLTELQQAILDFLWAEGPATSDQVREALLPKHPLKDPSVR